MRYSEIKAGHLLWNQKIAGFFWVMLVSPHGAFGVNIQQNYDPMPVWVIMPRDSSDWVIDDKNAMLTDDEKEVIKQRMQLWEMLNGEIGNDGSSEIDINKAGLQDQERWKNEG